MSAISASWLHVSWGAVYSETNYGLMQHSCIEIKNKLLRALDADYNVVDMGTVFEVVALLEKTPITQEILETTRLGKVINECRRRTNNEVLAKRAKNLLRLWRNLMIAPNAEKLSASVLSPSASAAALTVPSAISVAQQNGTNVRSVSHAKADRLPTPSISPALSTSSSHSRNSSGGTVYDSRISPACSLSPVGDPKVESVPKTHVANKRLRKNITSPVSGEPPAKASKMNGAMFPERYASITSPEDSVDSVLSRISVNSVHVTDEVAQNTSEHQTAVAVTTESVPDVEPPLPKKRSRKKGSKKKSQADDIVKEKLVALSKTGRVKTTEELVADLKSRTVTGSAAAAAVTADDSVGHTISVKPSLSNSVSSTATADTGTSAVSKQKNEEKLDPETRVEREIANILSKLPPINVDEIVWDDSPVCSPPTTPKPITEEDVDRYLQQQWDGVNGCVTHVATPITENDHQSENSSSSSFRGWHEMVARRNVNDELIHILPYSIVD